MCDAFMMVNYTSIYCDLPKAGHPNWHKATLRLNAATEQEPRIYQWHVGESYPNPRQAPTRPATLKP